MHHDTRDRRLITILFLPALSIKFPSAVSRNENREIKWWERVESGVDVLRCLVTFFIGHEKKKASLENDMETDIVFFFFSLSLSLVRF